MAQRSRAVVPLSDAAGKPRVPAAVNLVAWLFVIQGLLSVGSAAVGGYALTRGSAMPQSPVALDTILSVVLLGAGGIALLVAAVGLFRRQRWAWTLAMATQCWSLTTSLYDYLSNNPSYVVMAVGVLTVLLLNQREVRLVFEPGEPRVG